MRGDLTVVVPAFNEGINVVHTTKQVLNAFAVEGISVRVIVVLDGPDHVAKQGIQQLGIADVELHELPHSRGKGAALRLGVGHVRSDYTAFYDADLDIDTESLVTCFRSLHASSWDTQCAYGSKHHPESRVSYPLVRRVGSRFFHYLVRILFNLECKDTQTGVKVFRTESLKRILPETIEDRFLFDLEVLAHLGRAGSKLVEVPIKIEYQYSSSIDLIAVARMLLDLAKMRIRFENQNTRVRPR